jgi:predicted TIM-barrel fold metal-dependent hydrolase
MPVIDFHAHIFPDALAEKALPQMAASGGILPVLDGKAASLVASMDAAGIDASVIASIATKPGQFDSILAWSRSIASERLIPFASVHPDDPLLAEHVQAAKTAGLPGIKLHPYYQHFALDEPRMEPLYEAVDAAGLVLLVHCGFDVGFPRRRICDPAKLRAVADKRPGLRLVAAHLGGWMDWAEVEKWLLGRPVTLDLAACFDYMKADEIRRILLLHPAQYLVFGSDSPWFDQAESLANLRALHLPQSLEEAVLHGNAERLLGRAG